MMNAPDDLNLFLGIFCNARLLEAGDGQRICSLRCLGALEPLSFIMAVLPNGQCGWVLIF